MQEFSEANFPELTLPPLFNWRISDNRTDLELLLEKKAISTS